MADVDGLRNYARVCCICGFSACRLLGRIFSVAMDARVYSNSSILRVHSGVLLSRISSMVCNQVLIRLEIFANSSIGIWRRANSTKLSQHLQDCERVRSKRLVICITRTRCWKSNLPSEKARTCGKNSSWSSVTDVRPNLHFSLCSCSSTPTAHFPRIVLY